MVISKFQTSLLYGSTTSHCANHSGCVSFFKTASCLSCYTRRSRIRKWVEHNISVYILTRDNWTRVRWSRVWCKQPKIVLVGTTTLRLFYLRQGAPERSSSHQEEDPAIDSGFPFRGVVVGRCKHVSNQITRTWPQSCQSCQSVSTFGHIQASSIMLYPGHYKNGYFIICSADGWNRICVPGSSDSEQRDLCGLHVSKRSVFQSLLIRLRVRMR